MTTPNKTHAPVPFGLDPDEPVESMSDLAGFLAGALRVNFSTDLLRLIHGAALYERVRLMHSFRRHVIAYITWNRLADQAIATSTDMPTHQQLADALADIDDPANGLPGSAISAPNSWIARMTVIGDCGHILGVHYGEIAEKYPFYCHECGDDKRSGGYPWHIVADAVRIADLVSRSEPGENT